MGSVRRVLVSICAAFSAALVALASASPSLAESPWFQSNVGNATQVLSVVSTGGSTAKMDVWQRDANGWQPVGTAIPVHVGATPTPPRVRRPNRRRAHAGHGF